MSFKFTHASWNKGKWCCGLFGYDANDNSRLQAELRSNHKNALDLIGAIYAPFNSPNYKSVKGLNRELINMECKPTRDEAVFYVLRIKEIISKLDSLRVSSPPPPPPPPPSSSSSSSFPSTMDYDTALILGGKPVVKASKHSALSTTTPLDPTLVSQQEWISTCRSMENDYCKAVAAMGKARVEKTYGIYMAIKSVFEKLPKVQHGTWYEGRVAEDNSNVRILIYFDDNFVPLAAVWTRDLTHKGPREANTYLAYHRTDENKFKQYGGAKHGKEP